MEDSTPPPSPPPAPHVPTLAPDITNTAATGPSSSSSATMPPEQDATQQKRRAIQAIMRDQLLSDHDRRRRIQALMDNSNPHAILAQLQLEHQQELQQAAADGHISSSDVHAHQLAVAAGSRSRSGNGNGNGNGTATTPCVHYERKCNIIAPCCGKAYGCRVCHDELTNLEHGPMDRFLVSEIVCKMCNTRQPTSNQCINKDVCGVVQFAEYHCDKCNLWMESSSKRPFHCDKCGFCRVGGEENYVHCDNCAMCIAADTVDDHNCIRDKYKNNCPVCREDMYTSRHAPQDLPCGHAIHSHCFRRLASFDFRCPICKKTVVDQSSMAGAWAERALEIERQPMPSDLSRVVNIICNDCEARSSDLNWHFLGVQCPACQSFNTVVQNVVSNNGQNITTAENENGNGSDGNANANANDNPAGGP